MKKPDIKSEEMIEVEQGDRIVFTQRRDVKYDPLNRPVEAELIVDAKVEIDLEFRRVKLLKEGGQNVIQFPSPLMVERIAEGGAILHKSVTHEEDYSGQDNLTQSFARGYSAEITWTLEKASD